MRNVSSPLGERLRCPSNLVGAVATKNTCCARMKAALRSSMPAYTLPTTRSSRIAHALWHPHFLSGRGGAIERVDDAHYGEALLRRGRRRHAGADALDEGRDLTVVLVDAFLLRHGRHHVHQGPAHLRGHLQRVLFPEVGYGQARASCTAIELQVDIVAQGLVARPARLEDQRRAVLEADEARGEVLDVEDGLRRVVRAGAVAPRAFAAWAELGVGCAADGDRPWVAHHVEGEVQHMHAQVDQGTAT